MQSKCKLTQKDWEAEAAVSPDSWQRVIYEQLRCVQKDEAMSLGEDWVNETAWKLKIAAFRINKLAFWEEGYSFQTSD